MPLKIAKNHNGMLWHGSFFVQHSLALVNRELALALLKNPQFQNQFDMGIAPYEQENLNRESDPRFAALAEKHGYTPSDTQITLRHRWPPDFSAPSTGQLVLIQPWEFGSLPLTWVREIGERVAEVWVPSQFVRQTYLQSGVAENRVQVVPNGINPLRFHPNVTPYDFSQNVYTRHIQPDTCVFLFVGGTLPRKGIDVLLDAYDRAFTARDKVTLIIKDFGTSSFYENQGMGALIRALQAKPGGANIVYLTEDMTEAEIASLYAASTCLVHPYRGEGYGLPIAEAMACGKPTILTGFGAALDFANAENAYLIPARVQNLAEKRIGDLETVSYPYWAEPDRDALIEQLRYVAQNRSEAEAKGAIAAEAIHTKHTWDHAAEIALERLTWLAEHPIAVSSFALPMGLGNLGIGLQDSAPADDYEPRKQNALAETRLGNWKTACEELEACLLERPDDWDVINALGVACFRSGAIERAEELFQKGIAFSPRARDFHHNMAFLLLKQEEPVRALEHVLEALASTPDNPDVRRTTERALEGVVQKARKILRRYPDNQNKKAKQDPAYRDLMARYHQGKEALERRTPVVEAVTAVRQEKTRPRLSLCMIVKNEERFLQGCLESCQGIVDEMIIVDTGSTDRTIEIAESFGAKVIHHTWSDDFSEARNVSLAHATGDWALWLDADEEIAVESRASFREAIDNAPTEIGAFMVMFRNWLTAPERKEDGEMTVHHACRLFRRVPGVKFEGRIHEQNLRSLQALGFRYFKRDDLILDHYGYSNEIMSTRNKHERFLRMLHREVEECPDEGFRYFHLFNLGNAYFTANDMANAATYLAEAAENPDATEEYTLALFTELAIALHRLGRSKEGVIWCERADSLGLKHAGIEFSRAYCLLHLKRYPEAERAFKYALQLANSNDTYAASGDAGIGNFKTWYGLGLAMVGQERFAEGREWCAKALEVQPNMGDARYLIGMTYLHENNEPAAIEVFEALLARHPDYAEAQQELQRLYLKHKNYAAALTYVRRSAFEQPQSYSVQSQWSECCEALGLLEEAREAYERMHHLAPHSAEVCVNLGRTLAALGAHTEAMDAYAEAIKLDSNYSNTYFNAGDLFYTLGYYKEAANAYMSGLEREPTRASGFFTLGNCYFQTRDYDAATMVYQQALALDPSLEAARHNLELIAEMKPEEQIGNVA